MRILLVTGLCFSLLGCAANIPAVQQEKAVEQPAPKGMVTGTIKASGQPVKGMLVEAYTKNCLAGPVVAKTVTGATGEFSFKDMEPETYYIGINEFRGSGKLLPGFKSTCGAGRAFNGADDLDFQVSVERR